MMEIEREITKKNGDLWLVSFRNKEREKERKKKERNKEIENKRGC